MQHHYRKAKRTDWITCSTLRRVEPYATGNMRMNVALEVILAAPPERLNPFPPTPLFRQSNVFSHLQYPHPGRTLFHLKCIQNCQPFNKPCSPLRRVEPYATH